MAYVKCPLCGKTTTDLRPNCVVCGGYIGNMYKEPVNAPANAPVSSPTVMVNSQNTMYAIRPSRYCHACGTVVDAEAFVCPKCGVRIPKSTGPMDEVSEKEWLVALLLCLFLGGLGVHRFYVGKIGTGILWLLTAGWLGIGVLVDFIMIACGSFRDIDGRLIKNR